METNKFDYMRHCVQGAGITGNSYEARYNLVLENCAGGNFDMYGGEDRQDGTDIAGDNIYIHHNTCKTVSSYYGVCIRGIPNNEALVHHNWFLGASSAQINAFGNMATYMNMKSEDRFVCVFEQLEPY